MASLQGRPQRLCMREAQTTRNTLHSRLHQQFVTDILHLLGNFDVELIS